LTVDFDTIYLPYSKPVYEHSW